MRRWLAIFLLVLLPTQATWAVAAGYCIHKPDAAVNHFGHHEHAAHSHAPTLPEASSDTPDASSDATIVASHDCGHCHGHIAGIPPDVQSLWLERPRSSSPVISDESQTAYAAVRPERPKWVRFA